MQLGCVDTANGYGIVQKNCIAHVISQGHKEPFRYEYMCEAAISTVYPLHTCGNALAYWLKPFTH